MPLPVYRQSRKTSTVAFLRAGRVVLAAAAAGCLAALAVMPTHAASLDDRRIEAATPYPTELGTAAAFFRQYPASSCGERAFDADTVIYVCITNGRPQQFNFDTGIPGLLVLTGVSMQGEAPNLGASLQQLLAALGLRPTPGPELAQAGASNNGTYETASGPSGLPKTKPPFVGAWALSAATCTDPQEFYVNTLINRTQFLQYELECRITAASPIGSTWILALACQKEGDDIDTLARLTLDGPDRLTVEVKDGTLQHLQRCTGPVPAEYRGFFDDQP